MTAGQRRARATIDIRRQCMAIMEIVEAGPDAKTPTTDTQATAFEAIVDGLLAARVSAEAMRASK